MERFFLESVELERFQDWCLANTVVVILSAAKDLLLF